MLRILPLAAVPAAVLTALATLGPRPAGAYETAPWCAVVDVGSEMVSDCRFWSVEACVPHVLAGNRGVCQPNPAFRGPIPGFDRPSYGRHRGWR